MTGDEVAVSHIPTSAGRFTALFTSRGLAMLLYPHSSPSEWQAWLRRWMPDAQLSVAEGGEKARRLWEELPAYFEGGLRRFTIPLDMRGTPFQLRVWSEVERVGYGEVCTYAQIAERIGSPAAVRAVGAANGANPVPIIVPCHRIIGSNGKLVGYGGGLEMKRRLLELEGVLMGF